MYCFDDEGNLPVVPLRMMKCSSESGYGSLFSFEFPEYLIHEGFSACQRRPWAFVSNAGGMNIAGLCRPGSDETEISDENNCGTGRLQT